MPNKEKVKKVWDMLQDEYELGTPEEFEKAMEDADNREAVFGALTKKYKFSNARNQQEFDSLMGYGAQEAAQPGAVDAATGVRNDSTTVGYQPQQATQSQVQNQKQATQQPLQKAPSNYVEQGAQNLPTYYETATGKAKPQYGMPQQQAYNVTAPETNEEIEANYVKPGYVNGEGFGMADKNYGQFAFGQHMSDMKNDVERMKHGWEAQATDARKQKSLGEEARRASGQQRFEAANARGMAEAAGRLEAQKYGQKVVGVMAQAVDKARAEIEQEQKERIQNMPAGQYDWLTKDHFSPRANEKEIIDRVVNSMDENQLNELINERYGKDFGDLSQDEQKEAMKMLEEYAWQALGKDYQTDSALGYIIGSMATGNLISRLNQARSSRKELEAMAQERYGKSYSQMVEEDQKVKDEVSERLYGKKMEDLEEDEMRRVSDYLANHYDLKSDALANELISHSTTGLYQQGLSQYEAGLSGWSGAAIKGAAGFGTMVADSVPFMIAGGIGGFFGNMASRTIVGRALAGMAGSQFERAVIMRGILNSAKTQAVNAMVSSGLTFGLYDAASAGVQSYAAGNFSFGDMVMAGTKGFGKGALLGGMNTALHKMGERYATAAGKAGVAKRFGVSAAGYTGEVAFFTALEQIEKNGLTFDNFDWASVGEQAVLIGLMKMKGEAGKEEMWKDPKKIIENWRKPIAKELETELNNEDIETLVSLGYGKKSKSLEEWVKSLYALKVDAETGESRRADLEGALMDAQVPLEIRRKILYGYGVVTPEAMAWSVSDPVEETSEAGNKTWTVTSYTENSKPLAVKRFNNKREAEAWAENIKNGQVKNHITMMEQMTGPREKEIMNALYEMSQEGAGSLRQLIKSFNAVMNGNGTDAEKAMIDEAMKRTETKLEDIRTAIVEQARKNVGWDAMLEEALKKEPEDWTKEERERIEEYRTELRRLDDEVSLDPRVRMMNRVSTPEGKVIQATGADGQIYYVAKGVTMKENCEIDMEATNGNAFRGAVLVYDQNGENPRWMKPSELGQWNVAPDASALRQQLMETYDVNYGAQVGNIVSLRTRTRRADGVIEDTEKAYKVLYVAEDGTVRLEATDGSGEMDTTQGRIEHDYLTQQQYEAERIKAERMSKPYTEKDVENQQKKEGAGTAFAGEEPAAEVPAASAATEAPKPTYVPASPMPVDENLPEGHIAEVGTKLQYHDPNTDELKNGTYAGPSTTRPGRHRIVDERGNLLRNRDGSAMEVDEMDIVLPEKAVQAPAAPVAEAPASPENVNGMGTAQVAAPADAVGAGMPLNAKGKPDPIGNGVTPERALKYFEQELMMEPEDVKNFVNGMVARAGKDMEKIIAKRPDPAKYDDPMDLQQAIAEWTAQGRALREVENRWKAIAGEIKAREEAVKAEQERIRKEKAAAEEADRQKQWEIQRKETEERERKQREFMAELERKRQEQEALEAEQANEEMTGDKMAEQAVMEEQKRRERMRITDRLTMVGRLTDLDHPADAAMAAQVEYLQGLKITPESLRQELGSNFGKFGREGMLRLADNNGRSIAEIADSIAENAGLDANGQPRLNSNDVRSELINCIREGSASAIEALEKRVGIGTQRPEDRPEYWTPEKIAEYEAKQKQNQQMTEVQQQIAVASEEVNTSPTDAQKEAGNYKKGHVKLDGMEISIEQPKGSQRSGVDADGLPWSVRMNNTYGYIRGTKGKDKDHIDIYLSDNPEEGSVFVVDQIDPRTGEFDEHKVMYGFNSLEEAREAYLSNYMSDWQGLGNITEVNKTAFKVWLSESVHKTKPFADYRLVKAEQAKMGLERGYEAGRDPFAQDRTGEFLNGNEGLETIEGDAPFRSILKPIDIPADMPEHMVKAGNDAVEMGKKLHTKVNVCWDMSQIPEDARAYKALKEGKQVGGWYSAKDGEVYLYMPHLENPEEVMKTLLHETVAHRGMREMFGEDFETMLDNVYKYASEDLKKSIDAYWKEMGFTSQRQAVDEYIAKIAEEGPQSYQDKTLLSKVKGFIINALRKMGFDMGNYRLTDDDIRYMLAKSHDYMQYEKTDMESEYKPKSQIEKLGGEKEFVVDPFASRFDSVKPVGTGEFGNIYNQFKGRANDAVKFLLQNKDGEALGALHHDYVGEIDIVYGNDKGGLKKIARKHPEVLDDLQEILDKLPVTVESENKIKLEDDKHMVVISKGIFGNNMDKRWLLTAYEKKETGASGGSVNIDPEPTGKQNGTAPLQNTLVSGGKDTNNSSIDQENSEISDLDTPFSIRKKEEPKKKGIGYKVFYRNPKDGKLYPPMVANPNGADTPVGVWLDADAAPIVGQTKTGRNQVKAGGKGTQGGSGQLAYRPGWHLGEIPYALQFGRLNPETGKKDLFPKDFVWAEVEYAADKDYQEEAYQAGINANGKYQHSLAGLPHLPEDGYYRYRTNPNPETDPWIITGAMKVNRVLSNDEVDDLVRKAGREPQKREPEGGVKMVRDESTIGTGNEEQLKKSRYAGFKRYDENTVKLTENNYVDAMYGMGMKYLNDIHDELDGLRYMVSYDKDGNRVNDTITSGNVGQFEYTHIGQNDIVGYKKVSKNGEPYEPVYGRDLYKAQWAMLEEPMREYKEFYERMAEKAPQAWMKADLMSKARGVEVRMERMKQLAEGVEPTNAQFGRWAASDNGSNSVRYRDYEPEDQTRTENFKQWFGDWEKDPENASKVVDAEGKPMVVYHGTQLMSMYFKDGKPYVDYTERFHTFKDGKGFFTSDRDAAESFARGKQGFYEVYLDMKNPFVIDCKGKDWDAIDGYENPDGYNRVTTDYIVNDIKLNHPEYDGVIFKNVMNENSGAIDRPIDDYVPFKAEQIKSAVDNNGDFSRENKDIRYRDYEGEDPLVKELMSYTPEQKQENMAKLEEYDKADRFLRYNAGYQQYLVEEQRSKARATKGMREMLEKYGDDEVMRPKIEAMLEDIVNKPETTEEQYNKLVADNKAKKEELQEFYDHQKAMQKAYYDMIDRETQERIAEREKARMAQKPERYQHEWTDEEKAENEDYRKKAKKHFGTTQKFSEAGYILTDGSMLDFTGRHEYTGKDASFLAGHRQVDHREIAQTEGLSTNMNDFIAHGNVRILPESGTINLSAMPTASQLKKIKEFVRYQGGDVSIEFSKVNGDSEHYVEYDAASGARIAADITRYYKEGMKPQNLIRYNRTYHGSAADFDAFDHKFMGSGEGSRVYGWGTYVSENDKVAKDYAIIAKRNADYDLQATKSGLDIEEKQVLTRIQMMENRIKRAKASGNATEEQLNVYNEMLKYAKDELEEIEQKRQERYKDMNMDPRRRLYSVEIPDDNGKNYLSWNDAVSADMLGRIKEEAAKEGYEAVADMVDYYTKNGEISGGDLYNKIIANGLFVHERVKQADAHKVASKLLNNAGIVGVKVPTNNMRGDGDKSKNNYVIFDEKNAKIVDKTVFRMTDTRKFTIGEERDSHHNRFYQDENGNKDLVTIGHDVFEKMGIEDKPFRVTEAMAYHVFQHSKELHLANEEEAVRYVCSIMREFDHVRKGDAPGTYIFSVENVDHASVDRAVTLIIDNEKDGYLGIKTSGLDRVTSLEKKEVLWEKGASSSTTDTGSANVPSSSANETGRPTGSTRNQSPISERKGSGNKPNEQINRAEITETAKKMAENLNKKVKICQNADEISDESVKAAVKKAEAAGKTPTRKGWFNTRTGEIEVYAPAAESVEDVQKTVLHETVGHYGLRELLSENEQDYNNAMVEMYRLMNDKQKKEVQKLMSERKYDVATAMDEYLAKMAEDRGNMVEPGFWEKAKSVVKNLLRKIGIDVELTDGDLKYLLWSSHEALKNSREVVNADGSKSRVYERKTMDQKAADWAMRWHNDVLGLRSKWEAERKEAGRGTEAAALEEAKVSEKEARKAAEASVKNRDTDPGDDPTTPGGGGSPSPTGGRERSLEEMIDYDAQEFKREFERMKTENDQITLGARVREFIRNRMTPLAGKRMTASDINGLMRDVDYAITHKSKKGLERALNRMQTLIHQAEGLAQIEEMMKTLNTRTTTVDKKGMVKGVLVDEAANEVLNNIKSSYKQMLSTSYDERLSEVRREMRALKEQYGITRQDDPTAPEEFKTRMQELKEKQEALKAERDGVLSSQVEETIESLNTLEEDINNQIGNLAVNEDGDAVTPNATKLERLTQEKLTIEIRKKLAELRQMMSAKQEIQKELDSTGSPKERQRLEEEIDKMQKRINITSRGITEELKDIISEGRSRRAEFVKADMERQMKIVRMGCNAVRDKEVPDTLDKKNSRTNWQSVQGWFADKRDMLNAPIFSFNFMAKYIDHNNAQGDGEFYNYFMRGENGAMKANDEYSKGTREFGEAVNEKCKELFGGKGIDKVKREAAKLTDKKITKLVADKSIPEEEWSEKHVRMTKGQMLYAWLTWRQEAGRTKMEADGWTKRSIEEMQEQLGPEMLELGRWMTDDFLKALRDDKYNVTYEKVMGTSMHKAAHYFPLRIDKLSVQEKSEIGQDGTINLLPSSSSGNLIVRTTNRLPVDLSNDAFDVLEDYGRTMERWNAMAELTKDLNTLIKSQGFRNLMEANHEGLFERWKDACAVATASYNTKATDTDKFLSTLHNGFMQQAIGYGWYTAIKQTLSAPAFWLYSWDPRYWGKEIWYGNVFRSWHNYQWAKEHLPSFAERIAANDFGIEAINDKSIVDKLTRLYKKGGMAANKLVDAITVANGARAVYEYDKGRFMKMKNEDGSRKYTNEQADELAKVNAQIVFNESQQSSRNEFSAPIQKQRGIMQRSLVAFQNSNIGYRRMLVEGCEDVVLGLQGKGGNISRGFAKVLTVGILNAAWYMGLNPALAYNYFTGKTDDEEDEKFWDQMGVSVLLGYVANGTLLGPAMTAWMSERPEYSPIQVFDALKTVWTDAKKYYKKDDMGAMSWAIIDYALKAGGVNLEKFDGMYNGVYNAIARRDFKADDFWSIMNMARTQRRELANHDLEDKTATEYMVDVMRADKKIEEGDRWRGWWNGDAYNKVLTDEKRTEIINDYVKKSVPDFEPVKKQLEDTKTLVNARKNEILKTMPKAKKGEGKAKEMLALNQAIDEVLKDDPEMLKVYKRYVNSTAGRVEKKGKWVNETYAEKHARLTKALADAVKAMEDGSGSYTRVDNAAMELIWLEADILDAINKK